MDQDIADAILKIKERKKSIIVAYDPKKGHELAVRGIDLGTPNLSEAESIVDKRTEKTPRLSPEQIGLRLRKRWQAGALFLTMGEKGIMLFEQGKDIFHIPTVAREVYDVSGAGDTVIATATAALAAGASARESAILSNFAAGIVVGKLGTQTASQAEILQMLMSHID
jgi:rfaE bifunctional protein kinase chain/domain